MRIPRIPGSSRLKSPKMDEDYLRSRGWKMIFRLVEGFFVLGCEMFEMVGIVGRMSRIGPQIN